MSAFFNEDLVRGKRPVYVDKNVPTPDKFQTLMVDPPWPYNMGKAEAKTKSDPNWLGRVSSENKYGVMTIPELCALGAALPIADNAHLYLWYTNAFPKEALQIAEAWGFAQKTIITWVKTNVGSVKPTQGTGHYFPNNTEHMLFCVRGKLPTSRLAKSIGTTIYAPRAKHSQKPAKAYRLVEDSSPGPWLEVFSRTQRPGWFLFGDQIKPKQ